MIKVSYNGKDYKLKKEMTVFDFLKDIVKVNVIKAYDSYVLAKIKGE